MFTENTFHLKCDINMWKSCVAGHNTLEYSMGRIDKIFHKLDWIVFSDLWDSLKGKHLILIKIVFLRHSPKLKSS